MRILNSICNLLRFKKFDFFSVIFISSLIGMTGCDHSNPNKMTPPESYNQIELKNEISILQNSNAVDILFIVDNSASMEPHQQRLAANIQHFVESFEQDKNIDYHIGITSVFDFRYGNQISNFNPNGFLLPLKGETGEQPKYFYTRAHNNLDLLAKSIHIGVLPLLDENKHFIGPEKEQSLSPIKAAFTEPALSSPTNLGFYRPEARLAIILITDADDFSPNLSISELDQFLKALKHDPLGEKISTFGVLANRTDCEKVDPDMGERPDRILDFLDTSRGISLSLCKGNFAQMLSSIGNEIQDKTQKQEFRLQSIPELGTLKVLLGKNELIPGSKTWTYDPSRNRIIVTAIPSGNNPEDKFITIKYTQVNMQNQKNGRAKRLGSN